MAYYRGLTDHLRALEKAGVLIRVQRPVNKDTEIHPLVRLQFRAQPDFERKAFLFENVVDARGRSYSHPYVISCLAASREMYAQALQIPLPDIPRRWTRAQSSTLAPVTVADGPVHEEVHVGGGLLDHGGIDEFPLPISTPGFDCGPYITAGCWVTADPETGERNVGLYRSQVKSPTRLGVFQQSPTQGLARHWRKAKQKGIPLQAAVVLGTTPNIVCAALTPIPHGVDEFAVAGALVGEPVELVRCKSVDLDVPSTAEIVIEGLISTTQLEPEAPFGEGIGFMGQRILSPFLDVTCITHRRQCVTLGFLSQFPPAEDTVMRGLSQESIVLGYLETACGPGVVEEVAAHETSCSGLLYVIRLADGAQSSSVVTALSSPELHRIAYFGKQFILVNSEIDAHDADGINWVVNANCQPHRDFHILVRQSEGPSMDFSAEPPATLRSSAVAGRGTLTTSAVIIDATRKWPYPPLALPARQYMEHALQLWEDLHLPAIRPRKPLWGYSLGQWTAQDVEEAMSATDGRYYETGAAQERNRVQA